MPSPAPRLDPPIALSARAGWRACIVAFLGVVLAAGAVIFQAARGGSMAQLSGAACVALLLGVIVALFVRNQVAAVGDAYARELEEATQARDQAEASSHAKDEFVGSMGSQLRTPLNALLGWSALLRRAPDDAQLRRRGVETIDRNARALMRVVDEIVDMARVVRRKVELRPDDIDVAAAVRGALEPVRRAARAKEVRVQADTPPLLRMRADPGRVRQMLWKLASMALASTPPGGCVQVKARTAGEAVEVRVAAAGPAREDPSGLALVRNLAELQEGELRSESTPGGGTTFVLTLPAARAAEALPRLDGVTVLVVEDDPRACEVVSCVLAGRGAEVHAATHESWRHLGPLRADVVVSDVGADGKDEFAHVVAPDSGSKRALPKPVAPALLVRTVHELQSST